VPVRRFQAPSRIAPANVALAPIVEAPPSIPGVTSGGTGLGVPDGVAGSVLPHTPQAPTLARERVSEANAPVQTPKPVDRVRLGGDVLAAKIIHRVLPQYPPLARQARIAGVVQLVGVIDREGTVTSLQVLSGHPLLVKAALDAVRQWRYRPTLLNGQPVEVTAPITVHFTLSQ
jgi:protein TonB